MSLSLPRVILLTSISVLAALLGGCAKKLPSMEQQKAYLQNGQILVQQVTSQAVLDVWGPPTYQRREYMQFYTLENGEYVPFFRVPLGEAPHGWDNGVIPGEALFLAYADRGELLGFLQGRLVSRESLPTEKIHDIGKTWEREVRFKTQLEKATSPRH